MHSLIKSKNILFVCLFVCLFVSDPTREFFTPLETSGKQDKSVSVGIYSTQI